MLLLRLDEKSGKPRYQQILEQVRERIERRILPPGEKLPSTRQLADQLGVHRSTVAIAYQELWALGFVDLQPGARPCVRDRMQIATAADRTEKGIINWSRTASKASNTVWKTYHGFHPKTSASGRFPAISFTSLDMDRRLFPLERFRSCLNRALRKQGSGLLGYGDPAGFLPLRQCIATRLQSHGVSTTPDEILITNGSQQAIDLVLRMLASPGKSVAIESPTYDYLLPLIRFWGLKPLEMPLRQDGMDLSRLAKALRNQHPALVYTMPNFQNPTGVTTTQSHRERLLSLCEAHRVPILEDGFEEEMKYFGKSILPIKSMDKHHLVIYCGTFSKVLFPGVRIGWITAERECVEKLIAHRRFSELSSNMILQAAMHEFCESGYYDRHVGKMHRLFRRRMQTALRALRRYIAPEWAEWTEPAGGFLVWLKLKPVSPSPDWTTLLASHGVQTSSGRYFFSSETPETYVRLSISTLNEEEIAEGIRRLGAALAYGFSNLG